MWALQEKMGFCSFFIGYPGEEPPLCSFLLHSWKDRPIDQFDKEMYLFSSTLKAQLLMVGSALHAGSDLHVCHSLLQRW